MRGNETIIANRLRRSKSLTLLLVVLFTLSTMSLTTCSDNDNNTISQRVVQATVYFDDEGPAATAWVQDGDQNLVSDATLSINGRPFEVIFLGDEASDEDSVPIYYLELYDLKGGDSLTFIAKRSDGTVIYAPPSAQIPLPLELVEPEPDQTIVPGEEVIVSWAGGEGSTHIAAFYADDLGEEQYLNVQKYGDVEFITVPPGTIREAGGIIGVAALSGDHSSFQINASADPFESSFLVYRADAIAIPTGQTDFRASTCPPGYKLSIRETGVCCPDNGMEGGLATMACTAEFMAIAGAIVWGARWGIDARKYPKCPYSGGPLPYCAMYSERYSHTSWKPGCECCTCCPGRKCYPH